MTTQPDRVHHLLDRLLRGVLLPAEAEQLAGAVRELERRADQAERVARSAAADAHVALTGHLAAEYRITELEAQVARLTGEEQAIAAAYDAKVSTPPSAETLAFIADRIADGTAPRRKVRRRAIDSPSDTAQQPGATP